MTPQELTAAAWRKIAEIIREVDMDEHEDNDDVIDEMYLIVDGFEDQAKLAEADGLKLEGITAGLRVPTEEDFERANNAVRREMPAAKGDASHE